MPGVAPLDEPLLELEVVPLLPLELEEAEALVLPLEARLELVEPPVEVVPVEPAPELELPPEVLDATQIAAGLQVNPAGQAPLGQRKLAGSGIEVSRQPAPAKTADAAKAPSLAARFTK